MVGYYQTEPIPSPATMSVASVGVSTLETMNPVKSLVCSPDLTVFPSPPCGAENLTAPADDKPYQCLLCQKSFDQKSLYQSHLRSHGKDGEDPYRCNICSKTFAVPARLTRHYRTHTGEKPYQCEYCSKSFSVKENLSVHRRIHTNERPYKCDVCERAFEHSGKLHRHMRIHTGERPHKCTVCSKTFIQSGQLVIHMRTHTGEKPYVCKSCGKGFTCSKQLKVHTRTHTGEKPYTCDICGKSFGYNHVLKLHQVAHYGEKVYKCTLCHETFGSKKTMELHIKTHSDSSSPSSSSSSASSTSSNGTSPRDSPIEPVVEISQNVKAPSPSPISIVQHHDLAEHKYLDQKYMDQKYAEQKYMEPKFVHSPQSMGSDKENKGEMEKMEHKTEIDICSPEAYQRDFPYYIYPRDQYPQPVTPVNVNLLASVDVERNFASSVVPTPVEPSHVFLYPEVAPAYTSFGLQTNDLAMSSDCSSLLNLPGNDARRRVEAALEAVEEERQREYGVKVDREPMLTPPSSNPVSPAPSPDPLDLAVPVRETLILPPRKRCKMILESMESERSGLIASQRQSSVIQFARAS